MASSANPKPTPPPSAPWPKTPPPGFGVPEKRGGESPDKK
jgi:hypothetical protein